MQHPNRISNDFSPRQLAAIDLMLAGNPDTTIAEILSLDRKTLSILANRQPSNRQPSNLQLHPN